VIRAKRLVYLIAAVGCGLAGGLIALNTLRVQPDAVFSVNYTAFMIFIVIIGGMGTIEGPILGAFIFFALRDLLSPLGSWYLVVLGIVAIAVTLAAPRGLWPLITRDRIHVFPVGRTLRLPRGQGSGGPAL
jgi:branched-chain amino acid transport system permease protein